LFTDFRRNATLGAGRIVNVDVYQLMCHVMQLTPAPHNGSWPNVCDALADTDACDDGPYHPGPAVSRAVTSRRQDAAGVFPAIAITLLSTLFHSY